MDPTGVLAGVLVSGTFLAGSIYFAWKESLDRQEQERQAPIKREQDARIFCPHCRATGAVWTERMKQKKGISGGKATAAVLTIGWSLLAVGLSRREWVTEACCANCGSRWSF